MSKVFEVSFISEGRHFAAGIPIDEKDIKPFMLKYHGKKAPRLNNLPNKAYYVDADNRITGRRVARGIAQMEFENEQDELNAQEANQPPSKAVADAVAQAQEDYAADIERQKENLRIAAENSDAAIDAIRQEQDEKAEAGEFDIMDEAEPKPRPAKVNVSTSKPKWQYVKRGSVFRRVKDPTLKLKIGEPVYIRNGSDYEKVGIYQQKEQLENE